MLFDEVLRHLQQVRHAVPQGVDERVETDGVFIEQLLNVRSRGLADLHRANSATNTTVAAGTIALVADAIPINVRLSASLGVVGMTGQIYVLA